MMGPRVEDMLERERVANRKKHWVRAVTACNSRCLFCLDSDTPRNLHLPFEEVCAELDRGRRELHADKVIISGGEASLHPRFHELVAYARAAGYARVQTVTNGWMFADRSFYEDAVGAGLGEITFSLHGDTAALHDRLTRHEGSFARLVKGMVRAVRRRELIVNVDIVINAQNVAVLDRIVELAISLGVREFDLLSVIPQAAAYEHREQLFYDPEEHAEILRKVFRLNRHPGFTIWTNRFPLPVLEGLEDLIQDPHKMLDEVNGRRYQVRRYLDEGQPLDCREAARCTHCFIAPFCDSADDLIGALHEDAVDVIDVGADLERLDELWDDGWPFGARIAATVGTRDDAARIVARVAGPVLLSVTDPAGLASVPLPPRVAIELQSTQGLDEFLSNPGQKSTRELHILLTRETAAWLVEHRIALGGVLDDLWLHQPSWERMETALERDVADPRAFFAALDLPIRVSGLPACLCPGAVLVEEPIRIPVDLFAVDTGRLAIDSLARWHVASRYRTKSVRCRGCVLDDRCSGLHVNMVRARGFKLATPLTDGALATEARAQLIALRPEPPHSMAGGRSPVGPAPALPGSAAAPDAPEDPLATLARAKGQDRQRRRLAILD